MYRRRVVIESVETTDFWRGTGILLYFTLPHKHTLKSLEVYLTMLSDCFRLGGNLISEQKLS